MRTQPTLLPAAVLVAGVTLACGSDTCEVDTTYDPVLDPTSFVAVVDNALLPMAPGTKYTYMGAGETIEVRHTAHSRDAFARGSLVAAEWVIGKNPGLYAMRDVIAACATAL
jgi:hypothetical protein